MKNNIKKIYLICFMPLLYSCNYIESMSPAGGEPTPFLVVLPRVRVAKKGIKESVDLTLKSMCIMPAVWHLDLEASLRDIADACTAHNATMFKDGAQVTIAIAPDDLARWLAAHRTHRLGRKKRL
jgi:hypothetical protein